ncbi:MAG: hypothetical protein HUJ27_13305 [Rhodobacteraceae bacterium]|nr:hypothetical protein [Paracoccaceae bacterium]
MIVANLATYPPRRSNLLHVVQALAPQVDRLNVILNEFDSELPELDAFETVRQILPNYDTKDVGKFYPNVSDADFVLLVDDDLLYPDDYVAKTIERFEALGKGRYLAGYHASLYQLPAVSVSPKKMWKWLKFREDRIADHRKVFVFYKGLPKAVVVDQIASGTAIIRGADMPPHEYMQGSQKFVDVRLAKWCFEQGIRPVAMPREAGWIGQVRFEETIYHGFTRQNPAHVAEEIWSFAFKVQGRGATLDGERS